MLRAIVDNTNKYHDNSKAVGKNSRHWRPIDLNELKVWIAIVIYQGLHKESCIEQYWNKSINAPVHNIKNEMPLYRFQQIKRFLHISNDFEHAPSTKTNYFDKVEPLMSHIKQTSMKLYKPKSNVSIDEMMVQFSGRSAHTFKMKCKPIPEGFKILSLCDDGYTYTFLPTSRIVKSNVERIVGINYTGCQVLHLVKQLPFRNSAHNIYLDNYFTSIGLFKHLLDLGIGACGTVRKLVMKSLLKLPDNPRLDWDTRSGAVKDGVLAFFWQDNGPVTMLSTIHEVITGANCNVIRPRRKPRETSTNGEKLKKVFGSSFVKDLPIPKFIDDYNHNMNGVDIADQLRSYYSTHQTSRRTWFPLFFWLLDTAIINSYIIFKSKGFQISQKDFRHNLL